MTYTDKHTVGKEIRLSGKGLHTGLDTTVVIKPATLPGIRFVRVDLADQPVIIADVGAVSSTARTTTIAKGGVEVHCTEHILSALLGCGVSDAVIELDGQEVPILDGSALPFAEAIMAAGIVPVDGDVETLIITEPLQFDYEETGSSYTVLPADDLQISVLIDFDSAAIGQQYAHYNKDTDYVQDISSSRTFVMAHEVKQLLDQGLVKGGDLSNALVIADERISNEDLVGLARSMGMDQMTGSERGVINQSALQWANEPARHKLLDLLGDLALLGRPVQGKIIAERPGHAANAAFTKVLKKLLLEQRKLKGKPVYDPDAEPLMDIEAVQAMLPHRYPFLLVDKVVQMESDLVVGVKNVTFNEQLFQGHFPGNAVFPGVLQMEALAQTGGILALSQVEEPSRWDTYFLKMDNVKFKHKVRPGDTLILKMELMSPVRRGIIAMQGTAYVGNKIVSQGELTAQIVKRQD